MADKPQFPPPGSREMPLLQQVCQSPHRTLDAIATFYSFLANWHKSQNRESLKLTLCNSSLFPLDKLKCTKEEHLCTQRMLDQTLLDLNEM